MCRGIIIHNLLSLTQKLFMTRLAICFLLTVTVIVCRAQDDDMPDLRSKRDNLTKIPEKDIQADIAVFAMAGLDINMGKPPLRSMSITDMSNTMIKFDSGGIHVAVTAIPFSPAKHKLQYSDKYLIRIDSKAYFGSYGKIPKMAINNVSVVIEGDTVAIPAVAYSDLYEPNFTFNQGGERKSYDAVYFSPDKHTMYIYLLCNDQAGGYEVTWVIRDKKYVRRIVDFNVLKN
jgi:hypothetical protein